MAKTVRNILGTVFALLAFSACSDGNFMSFENQVSAWCVVQGSGNHRYFLSDQHEVLVPVEALDTASFGPGDRFLVYFVGLGKPGASSYMDGDQLIQVVSAQPVLSEDVLSASSYVGGTSDPLDINLGPAFGGGYLNMGVLFSYSESGVKHRIHLLQDSVSQRTIHLRLVHDANGDGTGQEAMALMSYRMNSLSGRSNADSLVLTLHDGTGKRRFSLALKDTL